MTYNLDSQLPLGETISGRTVMHRHKIQERRPGAYYATWVAICHNENELHPWVVWDIVARPEGFSAFTGDYCRTYEDAQKAFVARGGHELKGV